ncbi:MAG: hypothetical protein AABX28_03365 [Nanoarchaeota archaeon]|mgnify:CR=1 FL=1
MVREIKKEQGLLDALFGIPEKEVIYEDGKKIGEIRQETTLFGDHVERVYDTRENKISETRQEKDWLGRDVKTTSDSRGNIISTQKETSEGTIIKQYDDNGKLRSTTKHEKRTFGNNVDITRDENFKVTNRTEYETDWLGRPIYVEHKDSGEVDQITGQDLDGKRIRVSHNKRNLAKIAGESRERRIESKKNGMAEQITHTDNYSPDIIGQKAQEAPFSLKQFIYPAIFLAGISLIVGWPIKSYLDYEYRGKILRQVIKVADENKNGIIEMFELKKVHETLGIKYKDEFYGFYEKRSSGEVWGALSFLTDEQMELYLKIIKR